MPPSTAAHDEPGISVSAFNQLRDELRRRNAELAAANAALHESEHRLEQRVAERTRELEILLDLSRNVASTLELHPLLNQILTQLKSMVNYSGAAITTLEADHFVFLEYQGPAPRDLILKLRIPLNITSGHAEVMRRRAPLIIGDMWAERPWHDVMHGEMEQLLRESFSYAHSWMGVPLLVKDNLIGVLRIDHVEPNHFTERDAQLGLAFAHHAAIAIENARLYEQAQQLAALEERQKLARELHDSVSQALYGIALGARTARALLERDPAKAVEPLEYVLGQAEAGLTEMRALIFELRPESLKAEGLVAVLNKQAEALRARHSIAVQTRFTAEPNLSLEAKESLYRISQEALHNIAKHAHAQRVELTLNVNPGFVQLEIKDDGVGFDPKSHFPGHLGLHSMRERAERLGGTYLIESRPQHGTRLVVELPLLR